MTKAKKQNVHRKALSAGLWYTVSNLLLRGVNLITAPIFIRLLSKAEYGDFSNYVSVMTLLTIVTTFDLYTSVNRARYDYKNNLDQYMSAIAVESTVITGGFYLLCVIFGDLAQRLFSMDMNTIHIMFLYMLLSPAIQILQAKHRIEMRYVSFILISALTVVGNALASLGLILVMENRYLARLIGSAVPTVLFGAFIYGLLLLRGKTFYKKDYWKYALTLSLPLVPHLISSTVLSQFSRIMLKNMKGSVAAGEFGVVCNIMLILVLLWNSFNNAWQPWSMERMDKGELPLLRRASRSYMGLFFVLVGGLVAIGPEVLYVMGGAGYMNSETLYPLPFVLLSPAFQFTASLYVNVQIFRKRTLFASLATVGAAGLNIVLNLFLIPAMGTLGAGLSMLAGYSVLLILHYLFSLKTEKERLFDERFMLLGLLSLLAFSGLIILFYAHPLPRYALLLAALLLVSFLMRRDIGLIVKIFLKKEKSPSIS